MGGGDGHVLKVPLKGRLRSFSKYTQEKRTKSSEIVDSRYPSSGSETTVTTACTRDEPEGVILLTPTARRLDESSPRSISFDERKHRITLSRKTSTKRQTQIRPPHQSKKCMKKLPPTLSGSGKPVHSPWVTPTEAQVYYPSSAQVYYPSAAMTNDEWRMDIIQTASTQEQDLPQVISPAYKFVPIEMAERMEEAEGNEFTSFSSYDYDICSDEYMLSNQDWVYNEEVTQNPTIETKTKRKKSQKKDKKKKHTHKSQNQHGDKYSNQLVDKYSLHTLHDSMSESPSYSWWTNLEEGILDSTQWCRCVY